MIHCPFVPKIGHHGSGSRLCSRKVTNKFCDNSKQFIFSTPLIADSHLKYKVKVINMAVPKTLPGGFGFGIMQRNLSFEGCSSANSKSLSGFSDLKSSFVCL